MRSSAESVPVGGDLAEDFVVRMEGEGGGEGSDVGDERGVPERRRGGRQEGQLAHFAVGRGGRDVWAAGGARLWRVVLLHPETDHLTQKTDETMFFYLDLKLKYSWSPEGSTVKIRRFKIKEIKTNQYDLFLDGLSLIYIDIFI